jgi:hypothetical protein
VNSDINPSLYSNSLLSGKLTQMCLFILMAVILSKEILSCVSAHTKKFKEIFMP